MEEHLSIGKMAKLAGTSEWTLRHYDSIGLLRPVYISNETGYRYYHPDQVETLADIVALKTYGFSLSEIKTMLNNDEISMREHYQRRFYSLSQERDKLNQALAQLSEKIKKQLEVASMGKKILIVDDMPSTRMILKDILIKNGYEIAGEAENGNQAVDLYKKLKPDLVLLDAVMPYEEDVICGMEALEAVKAFDSNANIIMLTSLFHSWGVLIESITHGARDFLVKPFTCTDVIISKVEAAFKEKRTYDVKVLEEIIFSSNMKAPLVFAQANIDAVLHVAASEQPGSETVTALSQKLATCESLAFISEITIDKQEFANTLCSAVFGTKIAGNDDAYYPGIIEVLSTLKNEEAALIVMKFGQPIADEAICERLDIPYDPLELEKLFLKALRKLRHPMRSRFMRSYRAASIYKAKYEEAKHQLEELRNKLSELICS